MSGLLGLHDGMGDVTGLLGPYLERKPGDVFATRYGAQERLPYASELGYFKANPTVAGMAAQDNRVVMNPFGLLGSKQQDAVRLNEAARIWMRQNSMPSFTLTPEQMRFLDGNTYRNANDDDRRATIAARLLSGDPSAGQPTDEQRMYVDRLRRGMGL